MKECDNNINFSISPQYRVKHWENAKNDSNWERMVDIFDDRLGGRFLRPIKLIASDKGISSFSGFSILALDCLLIETLQQFLRELMNQRESKKYS